MSQRGLLRSQRPVPLLLRDRSFALIELHNALFFPLCVLQVDLSDFSQYSDDFGQCNEPSTPGCVSNW